MSRFYLRVKSATASLLGIAAFLSSCASSSVHAASFFVSPTGSDASSGTKLITPLHTIAHATQLAGPGDTIFVRGGIYREMIDLSSSRCGAPGHPMTITSYEGEPVYIKGSDVATGWTLDHGSVWKTAWTTNSQECFEDQKPLQQIGAANPFQSDIFNTNDGSGKPDYRLPAVGSGLSDIAPGSFYYDPSAHMLYCELADQGDPNKHLMEASVRSTVLTGYGKSYVTLHGLELISCNGTSSGDTTGVLQTDGSHWTADHCTFAYGDFCGLRIGGTDHTFRDCRVIDNGDVGVNLQGSDSAHGYDLWPTRPPQHILLSGLQISGNNYRHFDESWHAGGIKAIPTVRDVTVRDCKVTNNNGPGIWFDTDCGNITIENNFVYKNHAGIVYEISHPYGADTFGAVIRNNRIIENTAQGIYVSASQGATVENNTCYKNDFDIVLHGMPRGGPDGTEKLQNNRVLNNIVDGKDSDIVLYSGSDASGNSLDGNFYATDSSQITLAVTTTPNYNNSLMSIAAAQGSGFEQHGGSGDPGWVNPDALDFRLRPGSAATGKGWQPATTVAAK